MDVAALRPHAENVEIFGARDWKAYERIKASIAEHGVLQPLTVAPRPDGEGLWLLDGHDRADAARDLGIAEVPVIVRGDLDTRAKQICFMTESAQRKQFSHAQRARQERYAREAVLDEREALRADGERITQTIARMTGHRKRNRRRCRPYDNGSGARSSLRTMPSRRDDSGRNGCRCTTSRASRKRSGRSTGTISGRCSATCVSTRSTSGASLRCVRPFAQGAVAEVGEQRPVRAQ